MSDLSNSTSQAVWIFAIDFYFIDSLSYDHYRLHTDIVADVNLFVKLCHDLQLQILQANNIDTRFDYLICDKMKTCFIESTEYDKLKLVKNYYFRSWQKIPFKNVNDYVFSIKSSTAVCCYLLFTNRRLIRTYKSNNENCFSFFDFYTEAFQSLIKNFITYSTRF